MTINRRALLGAGLTSIAACGHASTARALTESLTDLGGEMLTAPTATIYTAREIVTLDPARPAAQAVAVINGRVLWTGTLEDVTSILGSQPHVLDRRFEDLVLVPGFIAQHDHPVLAALTMSSEILAIEDWVLPGGTIPAVKDRQDFTNRLTAAVNAKADPESALLTWGYHPDFFGRISRADLDAISTTRPIIVWVRSCHEMYLNTGALARAGVTPEVVAAFPATARAQSNFAEGHFWEQGLFALLPHVASFAASPEQLHAGLLITRDFMHAKGITFGNEPGGILSKPAQDGVNAVFVAEGDEALCRWRHLDRKSVV